MPIMDWQQERETGVGFDMFMALANLAKEIVPLGSARPIEEVWFDYRAHLATTDRYRDRPELFPGYAEVDGLEHITSRLDAGGVVALLHVGDYRHGPLTVVQEIRKHAKDVPLAMVVDQESYDTEASLPAWLRFRREYGVEFFIAETPHIGMQLMRHLRRGGWLFVYLDGNTGAGADASPLETAFLTSRIRMRSGLFRLLARTGSPVVPMVTDRPGGAHARLVLHPPVRVPADAPADGLHACFEHFRDVLRRQPELWRFWFRHHRQVIDWRALPAPDGPIIVDWRCHDVSPALGLSLSSAKIFRIA